MERMENNLCSLCFGYALNELTEVDSTRFARHLQTCERCRQEYEELAEIIQWVEEDDVAHQASIRFSPQRSAVRVRNTFFRWALPGAVALLAVGAGIADIPVVHAATHTLAMHVREISSDFHSTVHKIRSVAQKLS